METAAALVLCLVTQSAPVPERIRPRPNILVLVASDLRADAMGCCGNGSIRTPNFDAVAREGARFDHFYSAAPLSCPARAALLTGLYPHQNGVYDDAGGPDIRPGTLTLPRALEKAGYVCGFVGKAHLGGDPRRWGFRDCPLWLPGCTSRHRNPTLVVEGREKVVEGTVTKIIFDAALSWMERHKDDRWFLWLATTAPRAPYVLDPRHPYKPSEIDPPPMWNHSEALSDHDWAGYYSTIGMLDAEVGRLAAKLRELNLHDDTFMLVLSDNGLMMGSHGYSGRGVWFDECAKIPALARWPGRIKPGTRIWSFAVGVDVFPTICEVAGIPKPEKSEAVSLMPALLNEGPPRYIAYSEAGMGEEGLWRMVRADRFKYVRFTSGREHLYDMYADPNERRDLAIGARHADDLEEMRALLEKWLEATPK